MNTAPQTTKAVVPHPILAELAERRVLRRKVERVIDFLITLLDELNGDPDHEPTLGAPERHPTVWASAIQCGPHIDQALWAQGSRDEREIEDEHGTHLDDGEDEEPDEENGDERDRDWNDGPADMDGLCEQVRDYDGFLPGSNGGFVA